MSSYILSCCSTADLSMEHFKSRDIKVIYFHCIANGKDYPDDLGKSYPFDKFYEDMENGVVMKTSQVSVGEYINFFTKYLKEGKDVLHVSLSTGIRKQ